MSEIGRQALDWLNGLDPAVQTLMRQPSYDDKLREARNTEEDAFIARLAAAYNRADVDGQKISILTHVIALD